MPGNWLGDPPAPGEDIEDQEFDELDVIVVNYQTPNDLRGFLQSLIDCPPSRRTCLHIVNVEATSDDKLVLLEFLPRLSRFIVKTYNHEENIGFARAVNAAAKTGHGSTIAIFNADTRLSDGLLEGCCHAL